MKNLVLIIFMTMVLAACNNAPRQETGTEDKDTTNISSPYAEDAKVHVVYFHGKQRCKTCLTIQKIASETVAEVFGDNTDVEFVEIDFSLKKNEALADKYEVAWSSLIIISGDHYTNLTDAAFANALKNPEVVREAIIEKTREYINL